MPSFRDKSIVPIHSSTIRGGGGYGAAMRAAARHGEGGLANAAAEAPLRLSVLFLELIDFMPNLFERADALCCKHPLAAPPAGQPPRHGRGARALARQLRFFHF
jgi:hypothetical protein